VSRLGKPRFRELLQDLTEVPPHFVDPSFYSNWGDPREFTLGDMGVGECAGQVVSPVEFGLQASEREVFEALDLLDRGDPSGASDIAYRSMLIAARALAREHVPELSEDPEEVVSAFRTHLHETGRFHDPFAKGKFGSYLLRTHEERTNGNGARTTIQHARQRVEEAQLFIEAAHGCHARALPGVSA